MESTTRPETHGRTSTNLAARGLRALAYALALLPAGVAALATLVTRPDVTAALWARMTGTTPGRPTGRGLLARHAVLSVLLGVVAWVLLGVLALMVARGALYGFVDDGPYDNAWGGPTLAGAWLAHLGIALVIGIVAALLLTGVVRLHRILTGRLRGDRVACWVTPVALTLSILAATFVVAWTSQL